MPFADVVLRTPRLTLRPTMVADAPRLAGILAEWDVTRMLSAAPWPASEIETARWIATHPADRMAGLAYRFTILAGDEILGEADLDEIVGDTGDLGYWLSPRAWGKGYGAEAVGAVVGFAFEAVGLACVRAAYAADNPRSGRLLERLGFRSVGDGLRYSTPRRAEVPYRFVELKNDGAPRHGYVSGEQSSAVTSSTEKQR
jgi:RimJ/RimL family protein N-acetyltransferase